MKLSSFAPLYFASLMVVASFLIIVSREVFAANETQVVATLHPTTGSTVEGSVHFTPWADKMGPRGLTVTAHLTGLTPGQHGFHIHEKGDCSAPDGSSAGGHFNPTASQHGAPTDVARHAGDLGNITADAKGVADLQWQDPILKLDGPNSIIGKSVIVHEKADDLKTQPTGNAGGRVACGVISMIKDRI